MRPAQFVRPIIAAAFIALTIGLAACGDDDPGIAEAGGAIDSTPADGGSMGTGSSGAGAGEARTVTVEIPEFAFEPTPVEIRVGDAVVWENTHTQPHTATGNGDLAWNTGNLATGASSDPLTFEEAGTFTYVCALHPFMQGTVEVTG